jgi:Arc/MetJ family transcription regulator
MATEKISPLDKTSLRIDRKKMAEAQKLLGTNTIADTVDAALDEVIGLAHRRRVLERIRKHGGLGPGPEELRRLRTP